jgi:hypothetical protein
MTDQMGGMSVRPASAYADQNEHDHQAPVDAVKSGRVTAEQGL